jgi:hypothetical protein
VAHTGLNGRDRVRDGAGGVVLAVDAEQFGPTPNRSVSSAMAALTWDGSMPPLVSQSTITSAPAASAVSTTAAV